MKHINYLKTIYYNYKFFGLQGLKKLPLVIHRNVIFKDTSGRIKYTGQLSKGCIRIGSPDCLATKDIKFDKTIIDISGQLEIDGKVHIAPGSRISIDKTGTLKLSDGFNTTGNLTIICNNLVKFGKNCVVSWDVQIMDADYHNITTEDGVITNPARPVIIGDNVWIGCKSLIFKGVTIANGCVVGAASVVTKSFLTENCVIAGHGNNCQILKSDIHWER